MEALAAAIKKSQCVQCSFAWGQTANCRAMMLNYHEGAGPSGYFFVTRKPTNKIAELKVNPNISFLWFFPDTLGQLSVQATAELTDAAEMRHKVWVDAMKQYGYAGPDDPLMILMMLTINKVTEFSIGKPKIVHVIAPKAKSCFALPHTDAPKFSPAPVVNPTEAMALIKTAFTKSQFTCMATRTGVDVEGRMMMCHHNDQLGYFFLTRKSTDKMPGLHECPYITLYWLDGLKALTVHTIAGCYTSAAQRHAAWDESFRKFGYTGPDDEQMVVIRLTITDVVLSEIGKPTVVYAMETAVYEKGQTAMLQALAKANAVTLCSHKTDGHHIAARVCLMRFHPVIGWFFCSYPTPKIAQLKADSQMSFHWYFPDTMEQVHVQAMASVKPVDPTLRPLIWSDEFLRYGYKNADDDNLVVIRLLPVETCIENMGKPQLVHTMIPEL